MINNKYTLTLFFVLITYGLAWSTASMAKTNKNEHFVETILSAYTENINTDELETIYQKSFVASDVNTIETKSGSVDVAFLPSTDNQIHVEVRTRPGHYTMGANLKDGHLHLELLPVKKVRMNFTVYQTTQSLIVYLPKKMKSLSVDTRSGDVNASKFAADSFTVKSKSGGVTLKDFKGMSHLNITTNSGGIDVEGAVQNTKTRSNSGDQRLQLSQADTVYAKTSSGDIRARGSIKNITTTSRSGDQVLDLVTSESAELASSSGDITFTTNSPSIQITTDSNSGDQNIALADANHNMNFSSNSGDITLRFNKKPEGIVRFNSSSGDLNIARGIIDNYDQDKEIRLGKKQARLSISTSSGDASIY